VLFTDGTDTVPEPFPVQSNNLEYKNNTLVIEADRIQEILGGCAC
jgi:hypothetical protein